MAVEPRPVLPLLLLLLLQVHLQPRELAALRDVLLPHGLRARAAPLPHGRPGAAGAAPHLPSAGRVVQAPIGEAPCVAALGGGDDQGGGSSKRTEAWASGRPSPRSPAPPRAAARWLRLCAPVQPAARRSGAPAPSRGADQGAGDCWTSAAPRLLLLRWQRQLPKRVQLRPCPSTTGQHRPCRPAANPGCAAVLRLELPPGSARAGGGKGDWAAPHTRFPPGSTLPPCSRKCRHSPLASWSTWWSSCFLRVSRSPAPLLPLPRQVCRKGLHLVLPGHQLHL